MEDVGLAGPPEQHDGPRGHSRVGPVAAAVAGVLSVPLLFVSATSFVLALCLGGAGVLVGGFLVLESETPGHRATAALGVAGGLVTVALMVVPFLLQD